MSVRSIGADMPHWSEPADSGARGPALAALAAATHGKTLVIGPHAAEIVDRLTARELTFLVRGEHPAPVRGKHPAEPGPHVEVWRGSLGDLPAEPAFDTILALGGLDRTGSTESPDLPWPAALSRVLTALLPGGRLLLGLANPAGLHHLVALPAEPSPADWSAPAEDDPTRPAGLAQLTGLLRSHGLEVDRGYAAFPDPAAPTALLSEEFLTDPAMRGVVESTLRRALIPTTPLLADPRPIARRLLRAGLAVSTAPAWFVVASRPGPLPPPPVPHALVAPSVPQRLTAPSVPRTLIVSPVSQTPTASPGSRALVAPPGSRALVAPPGPHALTTAPGHAAASRIDRDPVRGWVCRVPGGSTAVALPAGRCLHDLLITTARGHDQPAMRGLLAAWQGGPLAEIDAEEIVVSSDGSLCINPIDSADPAFQSGPIGDIVSGGSPEPIGSSDSGNSPEPVGPVGSADPLPLTDQAGGLPDGSASGVSDGWRGGLPDSSTDGLPDGSGNALPDGSGDGLPDGSGGGLPGEALRNFACAMFDEGLAHLWPTPADEAEVTALLAEMAGQQAPNWPGPAGTGRSRMEPPTLRETVAERDRLRRELAEARAQVAWCEQRVAQRDAELIRANRVITALKATAPGRAATAVAGGLRSGKRMARAALRRLRPEE